jgi:flagellar hook-length control protein FliK
MQTAVKFFDLPFQGAGGKGADKIGIKLPCRSTDQPSGEENGFPEIMAALTRIPPQELKSSLAQLDWIQVEDSAGEFAPLIDLTDPTGAEASILQMLLTQPGTNAQAPPPPVTLPVGQADASIDAVVEQALSATDARQPQTRGDLARAVVAQSTPPSDASTSVPTAAVSRDAEMMHSVAKNTAVDGAKNTASYMEAVLSKGETIRPALSDRTEENARQTAEPLTDKTSTASLPSDPQSLNSKTLKQWPGNPAPIPEKPQTRQHLGRRTVSDPANSAAPALPEESPEPSLQPGRIQPKDRFFTTVSQRQAAMARNAPDENAAAVQEAGLQMDEKSKRQPLERAVRLDGSSALREKSFVVKPSEGAEMQMNSNTSREGAPSLDSPMRSAAAKSVEASGAAKESMPFSDPDTQIDVVRQIVQRMTLRNDGRQSQMVIRLKPDFLGNVRLQVITEGQQVMVRMDAESAMVKEIVEQNMTHLKAELSQHGLEIEKFDVFVGNDNDGWRSGQQQAGFRQAFKRGGKPSDSAPSDDDAFHQSDDSRNQGSDTASNSAGEVDYFA